MGDNGDAGKQAAAESAAAEIREGMIVGLGSGSTAALAVDAIGRRVQAGLRIVGVPTSERTAAQARALGIPLSTLAEHSALDVTIDGADEVERGTLNLIKGHGGALLREKIVATATKRFVIVVDETKLVMRLGERSAVPLEVVPFGWEAVARRLSSIGATVALRRGSDGMAYVSDGGHYILDCRFADGRPLALLAEELDRMVGVVEHGLFLGMTSEVRVGSASGVQVLAAR